MRAVVVDNETVKDGCCVVLATFDGTDAEAQASDLVGKLPGHERGRYGIDVCLPAEEAHCDGCDCPKARD